MGNLLDRKGLKLPVNQSIYPWKQIALQCSGDLYTSQYWLELKICITLQNFTTLLFLVYFIRGIIFCTRMSPVLFCFVLFPCISHTYKCTDCVLYWKTWSLGVYWWINYCYCYWEQYWWVCGLFFRDCTIWAPANGGVTQCFLRGNTQAAKKKKNLLVMLLGLSQRVITVTVQLFCSWGKGLVIPFGKDFFSEPFGGSMFP